MTYRSRYSMGGKKYFSVWKMFLGKVYQHDCIEIA
jgi:hypothetical protein